MANVGKQILYLVEILSLPVAGMLVVHTLHTRNNDGTMLLIPLALVGIRVILIKVNSLLNLPAEGKQTPYDRQALRAENFALIPLFFFEVGSVMAETISDLTFFLVLTYIVYVLSRFIGLQFALAAEAARQASQ